MGVNFCTGMTFQRSSLRDFSQESIDGFRFLSGQGEGADRSPVRFFFFFAFDERTQSDEGSDLLLDTSTGLYGIFGPSAYVFTFQHLASAPSIS